MTDIGSFPIRLTVLLSGKYKTENNVLKNNNMNRLNFSKWLSSSGGPLVIMDENTAKRWTGSLGPHADYDVCCQTIDYAEKRRMHDSNVLILGDEPLQAAVATADNLILIVRWKWAESETDVQRAINAFDFSLASYEEKFDIEWANTNLVIFDAANTYAHKEAISFKANSLLNEVRTLIVSPTPDMSLLIHTLQVKK